MVIDVWEILIVFIKYIVNLFIDEDYKMRL